MVEECIEYTVLCCYYLKKCWRRKISSLFLVFSGKKVYFCEIFLTTTANKRCQICDIHQNLVIISDMSIPSAALVNGQKISVLGDNLQKNVAENATILYQKSFEGVSPNCIRTSDVGNKWFLMRAAYGQEKKAEEILMQMEGVESAYVPQWYKKRNIAGKTKNVLVSIIPNNLFVRSKEGVLAKLVGREPLSFLHFSYQPHKDEFGRPIGTGRTPVVIPDRQMDSFRRWVDADAEDKIFRQTSFIFKENDLVRVTEGVFEGLVGHIVRLKGQTRGGVNIDGIGFISTAYIPKNCLEKID